MSYPKFKKNALAKIAANSGKLKQIRRRVYTKVGELQAFYAADKEPIPFDKREELAFNPISIGDRWGINYDCAWFNFKGRVPTSCAGKKISALINVDWEGCLFDDDGNPVIGLSKIDGLLNVAQPAKGKQEVELYSCAEGGEEIDFWVEAGYNKTLVDKISYAKLKRADLVEVREDIRALYYDYHALLTQKISISDENKRRKIGIALALADKLLTDFSPVNVQKAREVILAEYNYGEQGADTVYATGHAHIDLAWLWPVRESRRKGCRTFANQLQNIEKYDDYVFGASQAQLFQWVKQDHPSLYRRVKEAVANGRIEIQGGMWTEADNNVPCGESLIRQCVYGTEFWRKEFGISPKVCWLPDVFGFSGALPQIIKKCGMDYFLTIKLSWNMQNKWPYNSFKWKGIDDSEIIVHMPPYGNYCAEGHAVSVEATARCNAEKDKIPVASLLFGIGDGGGGPGEGHMESIVRATKQKGMTTVKLAPASEVFSQLEKYRDKMISHKGELYLEKHQGTLTTQSKTKRYNRKCEQALHDAEFLCALAACYGYAYPKEQLDEIWKEVLLYQFHDIIPGSSINRVYKEAEERYEALLAALEGIKQKALDNLNKLDKTVAVNTTPFARREYVKHNNEWHIADLKPYSIGYLQPAKSIVQPNCSHNTIENDLIKLTFDRSGDIVSLITKQDNIEHSKVFLNRLNVYKDKRMHYNAWDISIDYTKKAPRQFKLVSYTTELDGPRVIRTNTYKYNRSSLIQKVILTTGVPYVEFETLVNWQETHKMLRAEFRPMTYSDKVRCDIQMGNIKRSTKDETKQEKAQFEICAHKWVDLEDGEYGISLINDCKYGHRVKEGLISLNLLRSPVYPDPCADRGEQCFRYALYPYKGKFEDNNTQEYAYAFNNPIIISKGLEYPAFAVSDKKNIVIETIKKTRDNMGTLLRIYENQGKATTAKITCSQSYVECHEANMLEECIKKADLSALSFTPFEIKTIIIK
jgi:alpha-mannosidase